jgi:hypothetical protein
MHERRIIGLDLGIASEHTARFLDADGTLVAKRKAVPTVESLERLEQAPLDGAPPDTVIEVVMEPTGPAWLPIAVFFISRKHRAFRVSSAKASDLRKFLSHNAKSNGIDADTLARLAIIDHRNLRPWSSRPANRDAHETSGTAARWWMHLSELLTSARSLAASGRLADHPLLSEGILILRKLRWCTGTSACMPSRTPTEVL